MTTMLQRGLPRKTQIISLTAGALLCGLTACLRWPTDCVSSDKPDKVLFDRAISAVEHHHFDVANLTLQTLVNTYPDSEYAAKARRLLEDSRIAKCSVSGNTQFLSSSSSSSSTCAASGTPPDADTLPLLDPE